MNIHIYVCIYECGRWGGEIGVGTRTNTRQSSNRLDPNPTDYTKTEQTIQHLTYSTKPQQKLTKQSPNSLYKAPKDYKDPQD